MPSAEVFPLDPAENEVIDYARWLLIKADIQGRVRNNKHVALYSQAKRLREIMEERVIECEEIIRERRAFGLSPPENLSVVPTDSETQKDLKKELWQCIFTGNCSKRGCKEQKMPKVLLPVNRDSYWATLAKEGGFFRHNYGEQFVCIKHLRAPSSAGDAPPPKQNSSYSLKNWVLGLEPPADAVIFLPNIKSSEKWKKSGDANQANWRRLIALNRAAGRPVQPEV